MDRSALRPERLSFWAAKWMKYLVCALVSQILNIFRKKKKNLLEPRSNKNGGIDRNLWKSESVPAWIALEPC